MIFMAAILSVSDLAPMHDKCDKMLEETKCSGKIQ